MEVNYGALDVLRVNIPDRQFPSEQRQRQTNSNSKQQQQQTICLILHILFLQST